MKVNHLLHIRQSESESFHVMTVAGMYAVELFENLLLVLLLYALTSVANAETDFIASFHVLM